MIPAAYRSSLEAHISPLPVADCSVYMEPQLHDTLSSGMPPGACGSF